MGKIPRDSELRSGKGNGLGVTVRDNNVDTAIRILKKKIKNEGVLLQYKEKMQFQKPSERKRKERLIRKLRAQKNTHKF